MSSTTPPEPPPTLPSHAPEAAIGPLAEDEAGPRPRAAASGTVPTPSPPARPSTGRATTRGRSTPASLPLLGETTKTYDLTDPQLRTVGHLRRILQQKEIPSTAAVVIQDGRLAISWSD